MGDAYSQTYIEGTIKDSFGSITEIDSVAVSTLPNPVSPILHYRQILTNGNNIISLPLLSIKVPRGVIITANALCNTLKTLKGVAGDTGIQIFDTIANGRNSGSFIILFGTGVASTFSINSVGADADYMEFLFF